jgi:hypothetical protein
MRISVLSESLHHQLDEALGVLLTAYGRGQIEPDDFISSVMHMVTAVDEGNLTEVNTFIQDPIMKDEG